MKGKKQNEWHQNAIQRLDLLLHIQIVWAMRCDLMRRDKCDWKEKEEKGKQNRTCCWHCSFLEWRPISTWHLCECVCVLLRYLCVYVLSSVIWWRFFFVFDFLLLLLCCTVGLLLRTSLKDSISVCCWCCCCYYYCYGGLAEIFFLLAETKSQKNYKSICQLRAVYERNSKSNGCAKRCMCHRTISMKWAR